MAVTKPRVIHLRFPLLLPRAFFLPTSQARLAQVDTLFITTQEHVSAKGNITQS